MNRLRSDFGRFALRLMVAAVFVVAAAPHPASAATYGYNALGNNSNEGTNGYSDSLNYDNKIIGLGTVSDGVSSYLQPVSGTAPTFGGRQDLGLGVYEYPYYRGAKTFAAADIDGDGRPDYAVKYTDLNGSYLDIIYSDRSRVTESLHLDSTPGCNSGLPNVFPDNDRTDTPVIGDINHDGKVDITVIDGCGLFSFDEYGNVNSGWPLTAGMYRSVTLADLNGDGNTDLLVSGENGLQALRGDGTEIWHKTFDAYLQQPGVGDVDGDGQAEIVVSAGDLSVLRLDGTTKFTDPFVSGGPKPRGGVRLSDIDGDGELDMITTVGLTPSLYVYHLHGSMSLMSGFPVTMPDTVTGRIVTANVTGTPTGNDIFVPTYSGLVVVGHTSPAILYTIEAGYSVSQVTLGTTNGSNFLLLLSGGSSAYVKTYNFTVDGTPVTLADQPSGGFPAQNYDARRTGSFAAIPLRQSTGGAPDMNTDGRVNVYDLSMFLRNWHQSGAGDFNNDGIVDVLDLSVLLAAWTG